MAILIVDDYPENVKLLEAMLKRAGFTELLTASSAKAALDILGVNETEDAKPKGPRVDVILMDIMMPEMNGIEALSIIKDHKDLHYIPVIMVTALADDENLQVAFAKGALDYITKPIRNVELIARVQSALKLKRDIELRMHREKELLDATEKVFEANQILQRLSRIDALTGIANRRHFDETLDMEWRRAAREEDAVGLIMIDIDFFKEYNDHYGHQGGDTCLKTLAKTIHRVLNRPTDLAARFGGEEFAVVLPDTRVEGVQHVAETIHQAILRLGIPHPDSKAADQVTISLGVASLIAPRNSTPDPLISGADGALYAAKQQGRNRIMTYNKSA
jgi:diguanylate cyclase (GGDEF)-like protein